MYITETKSISQKGKVYKSVLIRKSYRKGNKVKNRTIGNLSKCTPEEIAAVRLALKNKEDLTEVGSLAEGIELKVSRSVGAVWTVYQVAKKLGLEEALGNDFQGKLAMWQVMARVLDQGSRLSAVRMAEIHAACEILGLKRSFDENDLYENLHYLAENKELFELRLLKYRRVEKPKLFLYDVTSSYLEGTQNELAEYGYNRDKKKGKKQIVIGLLCDESGVPVSVDVFKGNTRDPSTVAQQVRKVAALFGCEQVTFVGDRGMLKTAQIENLSEHGFSYITAITKPQIKTLLNQNVIQLEMFDEEICEVAYEGVRYVLRKNPSRAEAIEQTRVNKRAVIFRLVQEQNRYLFNHRKAKVETSLKKVNAKILALKLDKWLSVHADSRILSLRVDQQKLQDDSFLDGCYVIKTNLLQQSYDKDVVHQRYKDLSFVEHAFRTCKTDYLQMRPVYVRTKESTYGHISVVMFAYIIVHYLDRAWHSFDLTVEEGLEQLKLVCSHEFILNGIPRFLKVPKPQDSARGLLDALDLQLPLYLPAREVNVVTRKKIEKQD